MSSTVLFMSVSVDGFIAGPNVSPDNGLGDGGERLHDWIFAGGNVADGHAVADRLGGADADVWTDVMATGALLCGRRTIEPAEGWGGDHHDRAPIFVYSRHSKPPAFADYPLISYIDDLDEAVTAAKSAANGTNVLVHGSSIAQHLLRGSLLDEIQLHIVPVLLGQGLRLFDGLSAEQFELLPLAAVQGEQALHVRYAVKR